MTPTLITAPTAQPVSLAALKEQCRVDPSNTADDAKITALGAAAVAHLDGWTGVLGRCIMPQTWRVTATAGDVVLPMPDVVTASAGYEAGAADLAITLSALGPVVTITEACDITFDCAMPASLLPVAQMAIRLMVQRDYDMVSGPDRDAFERSIDALVGACRWRRV